jgi:hypothetical protein
MVHLGKSDFSYRSNWGTAPSGQGWDVTQIYNNTIYLDGPGINAMVAKETLAQAQTHGGDKGRFVDVQGSASSGPRTHRGALLLVVVARGFVSCTARQAAAASVLLRFVVVTQRCLVVC